MSDQMADFDDRRRSRPLQSPGRDASGRRPSLPNAALAAAACAALSACSAQTTSTTRVATTAAPPVALAAAPTAVVADAQPVAASAPMIGKLYAPSTRKPGSVGVGLASWYGPRFHGRRTANGETFDKDSLTAAHPTLPLPSYVRVTNVSNGRSLVVRVNDRGPFHKGRLIDVSQRTADVLGFRGAGVGNVKVDYIGLAGAGASDNRKLIATYQEFGRPTAPEGMQVARLRPVSDAELVGGAPATGVVLARADAPAPSVAVGLRGPQSVTVAAYAPQPAERPLAAAMERPAQVAVRPAAVAGSAPVEPAQKRVVRPSEPVLASVAPAVEVKVEPAKVELAAAPAQPAAKRNPAVSARIAASFEGFDSFGAGPQAAPGAFTGLR